MNLNIIPQQRRLGHKDCLYTIAFENDKNSYLTAGGDGLVARWQADDQADATLAAKIDHGIYAMLLLPGAAHLLLGTNKGGLHLIDLLQHRECHLYQRAEAPIFDLALHNDRVYQAQADGFVSIWERNSLSSLQLQRAVSISTAAVRCLLPHPTENRLAAGCSDGSVCLLDANGNIEQRLHGHSTSVFSLLWLAGGKYLLSGSRDAHLGVWETASGKLLERVPAHLFTINHLLHLPELGVVASAGRDKTIKLWDDKSLELLKVANYDKFPGQAHSHSVNKMLWLPKQYELISVGDDRKVIVWALNKSENR